MKKAKAGTLILLTTALIAAVAIPIAAFASTDYSIVKVKIRNGTPATQTLTVYGSFTLKEDPSLPLLGNVTIKNSGGSLVVSCGSRSKTVGAQATFASVNASSSANLIKMKGYIGTNNYAGDMIFSASGGGVRAINRVPMEMYMLGVLYAEMGASFKLEALKAQAVAARSYAAVKINSRKNNDYHLDDGPTDQAYRGYVSTPVLSQAVEQTSGQMVLYDGKVVEALYSAAHGGQTDVPGNKYGGGDAKDKAYPYLAMFDDPYDLQASKTQGHYESTFLPKQLKGNQNKVNSVLWGDIMSAFGLSRSSSERNLSGASINSITPTLKFGRTSASRFYTKVTLNVTVNSNTKNVAVDLTQLRSRGVFKKTHLVMTSMETGSDGWYLTQQRYGHGLGMSQWGANQMAMEGFSYKEILGYYYKNCSLASYDTGGWTEIAGEYAVGLQTKEDGVYYYKSNGTPATGWHQLDDGSGNIRWYHFSSTGKRNEGWIKPYKVWYYLEPGTGIMTENTMCEINDKLYAFAANGAMLENSWRKQDSDWYYLGGSGAAISGWKKDKNIWYYLSPSDNKMLTGVQQVEGKIYVFSNSGEMQAGKWCLVNNSWYFMESDGSARLGWKFYKYGWYYLNPNNGMMLTGEHTVDGKIYVFDNNGKMISERPIPTQQPDIDDQEDAPTPSPQPDDGLPDDIQTTEQPEQHQQLTEDAGVTIDVQLGSAD